MPTPPTKELVGRAFGRVLLDLREKAGLSQSKLSALTGLSRTYVSYLEKGTRQPSLLVLILLAEALGVTASHIVHLAEMSVERDKEDE